MEFYINLIMYILAVIGIIITNLAVIEEYYSYSKSSKFLLAKKSKTRYYKKEN